eukprot:CAMPEP_0117554922 /NCGR_PEP_ID=MMETSP0784-20121206/51004_1 /TAXON_ID=39447 /ORGANISM="" /LENGTH=88 /DNA_ID=CAMNT_0005352103 /DNA_START=680 /DNA_END=943 /DNA_ORIENTATION=-
MDRHCKRRCSTRRQSTPGCRDLDRKSPPSSCNSRTGSGSMLPSLAVEFEVGVLDFAELRQALCRHWESLLGLLVLSDETGRGQTPVMR